MFIQNKYYNWYYNIIQTAQTRTMLTEYFENHHIVPQSLSGSNDKSNIVSLTAREHFICHVLLTKFTIGNSLHKMLYAANMMSQISRDYQHRYIPSSRLYEIVKKKFGIMHSVRLTGRKLSDEHKAKISAAGKGRKNSAETIAKRSASCTGLTRTTEQRERMSAGQLTRKHKSDEEKKLISEKISLAKKGKSTGPKTEKHKENLSKSLMGKFKGVPKSEETKQKMHKPKSEAHRKAISDGRKARYAALRAEK